MKKTIGFYLAAAAAILAVVALVFYQKSGTTMPYVTAMAVAAIVLDALYLCLYKKFAEKKGFSLLVSCAAVMIIGAVGYSLIVEVEIIGYLLSGLRQWKDVQFWAYFAVVGVVSWLLLLVASFIQPKKKEVSVEEA
ncbi:MAG: hypothetical protein Q4B26_13955 [Eubacteriales bacterium]|nr:hypothetical protein [Eubacteriales bacterium]